MRRSGSPAGVPIVGRFYLMIPNVFREKKRAYPVQYQPLTAPFMPRQHAAARARLPPPLWTLRDRSVQSGMTAHHNRSPKRCFADWYTSLRSKSHRGEDLASCVRAADLQSTRTGETRKMRIVGFELCRFPFLHLEDQDIPREDQDMPLSIKLGPITISSRNAEKLGNQVDLLA